MSDAKPSQYAGGTSCRRCGELSDQLDEARAELASAHGLGAAMMAERDEARAELAKARTQILKLQYPEGELHERVARWLSERGYSVTLLPAADAPEPKAACDDCEFLMQSLVDQEVVLDEALSLLRQANDDTGVDVGYDDRLAALDGKVKALADWRSRSLRLAATGQGAKPLKIWYMRDNHTFRALPLDVEAALAAVREEWNDGYTHGMLCSGSRIKPNVHGRGNWTTFVVEALAWLERAVDQPSLPQP